MRSVDQIGERVIGKVAVDHDERRKGREFANRYEIRQRIIVELAQMRKNDE